MKTPIISDLSGVTQPMIDCLEKWLEDVRCGRWEAGEVCPFALCCAGDCRFLFTNFGRYACRDCPCDIYGQEATILAFQIIIDVWPVYHGRK